jgi:MFS family permease
LAGVLISAQSIGTLAAAAVIANLGALKYHGRIFCFGTTLQFLSLLSFALSPWYGLSLVMLVFVGLGVAGFSTMQNTIILISAAPEMRGRALGVLGQCIGVAALGGLAIGGIANYFDARIAVAISAVIGLVLLAPVIALSPLVRHPTMPPDTVGEARSGNTVNQASQTLD